MLYMARGKRAGFTLIEIMIVIAIIAILAGIVVPNFMQARQEAYFQACSKNCETLVKAAHMVAVRHSPLEIIQMNTKSHVAHGYSPYPFESDYNSSVRSGHPYYYITPEVFIDYGYLEEIPHCPTAPKSNYCYDICWSADIGWLYNLPELDSLSGWVSTCLEGTHYIGGKFVWPVYVDTYGSYTWVDPS